MPRLAILLFCTFVIGCATDVVPYEPGLEMHIINIDRNGNFVPYGIDKNADYTKNEKDFRRIMEDADKQFDEENVMEKRKQISTKISKYKDNYDGFLNRLFDSIDKFFSYEDNNKKEILIFVHGGLNEHKNSIARAKIQYKKIIKDTSQYPIFINWRSGGGDSYWDHLTRIRQGEEKGSAKYTSIPFFLSDILGSIAYAPKAWGVQGKHTWDSIIDKDDRYDVINETDNSCQIYSLVEEDHESTAGREAYWLLTSPFKLVTTPFVYTMSKPAWDIMIRRSQTVFRKPKEYGENKAYTQTNDSWYESYPAGSGALSVFFSRLLKISEHNEGDLKIALYGHSMGAILCNDIVDLFPKLNFNRIVHMASADSARSFYDKTIPYMMANEKTHFYSLHLAPINEDRETSGFGTLPSGSLLTWIDNSFTSPPTELDRRAGRWNNIKRTHFMIPKKLSSRVHFKIFGIGKKELAGPQVHGDFDNVAYWTEGIYWKNTLDRSANNSPIKMKF